MPLPLISTLMVCFVRGTLPSSAKSQLQLRWLAELALISVNPATHPLPPHQPHPHTGKFI